jgi:hypothetical protein
LSDRVALEAYDRLLASIGQRAVSIGSKGLASHWPHVGNNYRGLVVAGQALQGWDPQVAGARWHASHARTEEGRAAIIERTRTWFADAVDPVGVVATLSNRRGSPRRPRSGWASNPSLRTARPLHGSNSGFDRIALDIRWEGERFPLLPLLQMLGARGICRRMSVEM